jgi:serine protease Do
MRCFAKCKIAAGIVTLACIAALPSVNAQARVMPRIFEFQNDGAYLGIHMEDVTTSNMSAYKLSNEAGVVVRSVVEGSPAETAKIQENDVILEFGGFRVWSCTQLTRLVQETPPGRDVTLVISRNGERINLTAKLGKREERQTGLYIQVIPRPAPEDRNFQFRMPDFPRGRFGEPEDRRARLGITVQPLTDQLAEFFEVPGKKGVLVASIFEGSPCSGKLQSGDVIIAVDGKEIQNPGDLTEFIRSRSDGDVNLKVIRAKKEIAVVIHLPKAEGNEQRGGFRL